MSVMSAILDRIPLRHSGARWSRLFGLGALVGLFGGLAAAGLEWALHQGSELLAGRFTYLGGAEVYRFQWGVLLLPAAGGLAAGVIVQWLCPRALGHGTDVLTRAFHRRMGKLPLKSPFIKALATVGVISCGGSAGPEGPIAALGAGIGSTLGGAFRLTPRERRILLLAGCAAGIGAIFRCPLGGALFATSVLYREPEFESDAIVASLVASVVGYSIYMSFLGFGAYMLTDADRLVFAHPWELIPYAILGPLCGLVSIFFAVCMRAVEKVIIPRSGLPRWFAPAVGGLATGALACILPQVMDGQYQFVRNAMTGALFDADPTAGMAWWALLFGCVALVKCVATACTVGSGASGGVLGPTVFIGAATGAFLGAILQALYPGAVDESLRQALIPVGMAGVLAAGMRVPIAALVMITEMTGSYGLIVPLMLVCSSAYVVGRRWGLNDEQVRTAADSPAHAADAVLHMLESNTVSQLTDREWHLVATPDMRLHDMVEHIRPGTRPVFAVIDGERIVGLISVPDIQRVMEEPNLADALIASDMMTERLAVVFPDQDLYQALEVLRRENHDVLPVVARDRSRRWLGMVTRERIFETVQRHIEDIHKLVLREHTGLAAMEQEGRLQQLAMGVTPRKDIIQRLLVPVQALGQSLRQADFRKRFGAQVIAIEHPDGTLQCPPDPDAPLQSSQRLVAIVHQG